MDKQSVLIVDDEPEFVELTRILLEAHGFAVLSAPGGDEGIATARAERPDLILLDLTMPGRDGFDVLSKLRSIEETRTIPVVMLTSRRESRNIMKSQELRAADYVMKPCGSRELLAAVRKNMHPRHTMAALLR